jgi:hypothetical protein
MKTRTQTKYIVQYEDRMIETYQTNDWPDLCRLLLASIDNRFSFALFIEGVSVSREQFERKIEPKISEFVESGRGN